MNPRYTDSLVENFDEDGGLRNVEVFSEFQFLNFNPQTFMP